MAKVSEVKKSVDYDTKLAQKALTILIRLAIQKRTTNYSKLATDLGLPDSGNALGQAIGPVLGDVYQWCEKRGFPPLTALVVRKSGADEGLPGKGFWDLYGLEEVEDELIANRHIFPSVSHDTIPRRGNVFMVKAAKNIAYAMIKKQIFDYFDIQH